MKKHYLITKSLVTCFLLVASVLMALPASAQQNEGQWVDLKTFEIRQFHYNQSTPVFAVKVKDVAKKPGPFLFPANIYFSEKPDGKEEGYYAVSTTKFTARIGSKKNEIKFEDLQDFGNGWRGYSFDKPLYIRKGDANVELANMMLLVKDVSSQNQQRQSVQTGNAELSHNQKIEYSKSPMLMIVSDPQVATNENEFTTPEKAGYLLVNTKTMSGFKCEYFAEGVVRVHFGNGDFAVFSDEKVFSNGPNDQNPGHNANSIGDWQIHAEDGGVVRQENGIVTITNPNGSIVKSSSKRNLRWDVDWKKPIVFRDWFPQNLVTTPGNNTPLKNVSFKKNSNYSELKTRDGFSAMEVSGNMIGNRVYTVNEEGELFAFIQIVDGLPIPALESDSVIGIKTEVCKNRWGQDAIQLTINYANGDNIVCTGESDAFVVNSGTIHRNGGVLTIKDINEKTVKILTFPNNDKYVGDFNYRLMYPTDQMHINMVSDRLCLYQLAWPELQYWNGTLIKADGKRIEFKEGKTDQQIAAEKKAAEAKATAQYNDLCKKFGKKYVDAALNQLPIVGMPEELLNAAFTLKFIRQSGDYKLYRITGLGWKNFGRTLTDNATLYSIWVKNSKVVDVRYWGN